MKKDDLQYLPAKLMKHDLKFLLQTTLLLEASCFEG